MTQDSKGTFVYPLLLLFFLVGVQMRVVLFAAPLYALELNASEVVLGGMAAAYVSAALFFSFIGAALSDRWGRRPLIRCSSCFFAAASILGMRAVSPIWLLGSEALAGVADLLFTVGGLTYLTEVAPRGREHLVNNLGVACLAAGTLAGSYTAGFVADRASFQAVFLLELLVSILTFGVALVLPEAESGRGQQSDEPRDLFVAYRAAYGLLRDNKWVRLVPFVTGFGSLTWFTFGSSFYLDYLRQIGASTTTIGFVTGLGSTAMMAASLAFHVISKRTSASSATLFGLLFGSLGLAAVPFMRSVPMLAVTGTLAQMATFFRIPGVLNLMRLHTSHRERATAMAVNNTAWAVAAFVGGPLWGLVARVAGLASAFLVAGLATALGVVALWVWSHRATRQLGAAPVHS
jgi:MFS family permease